LAIIIATIWIVVLYFNFFAGPPIDDSDHIRQYKITFETSFNSN
jgi:hypothetical protein